MIHVPKNGRSVKLIFNYLERRKKKQFDKESVFNIKDSSDNLGVIYIL